MKTLPIIILLLLTSREILAQTDRPFQNLELKSPNAAALEKFGTIPVNYHTGIPEISIPIYEISQGSLTLPISLNYHAGGLKVIEVASWIGTGWTLLGGNAAITRTVMGAPDEDQDFTSTMPQYYGHYTHYGYNSYVRNPPDPINYATFADVASGEADGEPDIYHFNFNGHSGKFYFDDDRSAVFEPASDYKIRVLRNSVDGFYKLIITTPDGTKYHFGQGEDENGNVENEIRCEATYPFREETGSTFHAAISSWLLTKIESADGKDVMRLHYVSEKYGYHTFVMAPDLNSGTITRVKNSFEGWRLSKITFSNGYVEFIAGALREDLCAYNLWTGTDDPNLEAKRLESIIIHNTLASCHRKFSFSYSYFNDQTSPTYYAGNYTVETDRKRLKLDEVQEIGCGTDPKPAYIFTYYDGSSVPRRLSYAQDHWGYYNGKTANASLRHHNRGSMYPAIRAGTLSKIQYPTGGSTTFEYEANKVFRQYTKLEPSSTLYTSHQTAGVNPINKMVNFQAGDYYVEFASSSAYTGSATLGGNGFSKVVSNSTQSEIMTLTGNNTLYAYASDSYTSGSMKFYPMVVNTYAGDFEVGGLRVARTINSTSSLPGNPDDVISTYDYSHNGISSGVLYGRPVYVSLIRNDFDKVYGIRQPNGALSTVYNMNGCKDIDDPQVTTMTSMTSIFPLDHSQGYHIGYKYVTVSRNGGQSQYQYDVADIMTAPMDRPIAQTEILNYNCTLEIPNYPPAPLSFVPGRGSLVAEYHYSGSTLKKEIRYEDTHVTLPGEVPGMIHTILPGVNKPYTTFYKLKTARLNSRTITTKTFDDNINDYVETVQMFTYGGNDHNQLTSEQKSSNSGTFKKDYKYPLDYTTGCEAGDTSLNAYNSALSTCISTHPYDSYSFSSANWYNTRLSYDGCVSTARSDYAHDRETDRADTEACLDSDYALGSADYKALIKLLSANRQEPIETSQWKDNKFLGSGFNVFKDYGSVRSDGKTYPLKVYLFETGTPQPSNSFTWSYINGSSIVPDIDYQDIADVSYEFKNGRLSEFISRDEVSMSYQWGYNESFPVAQVLNAKRAEFFHENFEGIEGNSTIGDCKTGQKSSTGGYHKIVTGLPPGIYRIDYWSKVSGVWQYQPAITVNITSGSYPIDLPGQVDDVRIYPFDAQMTTYTYDPLDGINSVTDANGITTYYLYDAFGRLQCVKDHNKNIVKSYSYHYKQ